MLVKSRFGFSLVGEHRSPVKGPPSLRVREDVHDVIGIAADEEVEAPIVVDAGLPEVLGLVVLLGAERRVTEVLLQEPHLLEESLAYGGGRPSRVLPARSE